MPFARLMHTFGSVRVEIRNYAENMFDDFCALRYFFFLLILIPFHSLVASLRMVFGRDCVPQVAIFFFIRISCVNFSFDFFPCSHSPTLTFALDFPPFIYFLFWFVAAVVVSWHNIFHAYQLWFRLVGDAEKNHFKCKTVIYRVVPPNNVYISGFWFHISSYDGKHVFVPKCDLISNRPAQPYF